ncbi:hypothetical protein FGO68_gene6781 [Halteria grandinella]|uniref:Uncharacterized protein n=1 Tax=Halteria grandinella TaxID=5974 RepID=A0A8J8SWI0_HALGN|nr:hypothetical protein FGO68_gene6781 [Halteria grandinella]
MASSIHHTQLWSQTGSSLDPTYGRSCTCTWSPNPSQGQFFSIRILQSRFICVFSIQPSSCFPASTLLSQLDFCLFDPATHRASLDSLQIIVFDCLKRLLLLQVLVQTFPFALEFEIQTFESSFLVEPFHQHIIDRDWSNFPVDHSRRE